MRLPQNAGLKEGNLSVPDRRDAVGGGRAMERNDSVAALRGANADRRIASQHSRDHGENVDPSSAGAGARWNPGKTAENNRSTMRALLDFKVWADPAARFGNNLRVGKKPSQTSQQLREACARHLSRPCYNEFFSSIAN